MKKIICLLMSIVAISISYYSIRFYNVKAQELGYSSVEAVEQEGAIAPDEEDLQTEENVNAVNLTSTSQTNTFLENYFSGLTTNMGMNYKKLLRIRSFRYASFVL